MSRLENQKRMEMEKPEERTKVTSTTVENCFKIMKIQGKDSQIYVPACIQFKIRNFTEVNFDNLEATAYGVLCVNFLIFTQNKQLQDFLVQRLYFNPEESKLLQTNRRKKMEREQSQNYIPLLFNKDDNIKIPTTRTKEFQIQSFKTDIYYNKGGTKIRGVRIFHTLRKDFSIQIIKNGSMDNFLAPFDFIDLELIISIEHMDVGPFQYEEKENKEKQELYRKKNYYDKLTIGSIKRVNFNLLRIEEPFLKSYQDRKTRVQKMAPMISYSSQSPFGSYDVVETQLEAYTHDERQLRYEDHQETQKKYLFEDYEPTQLPFKPFKYVVFKIPLFRHPVVDMMTIFIPLWLLSFVSVYIYFETTEIMNRIVNVAGLMIAYAAIQPIVRDNLPEAITITLVDLLIYSELLINILFLVRTIDLRNFYDDPTAGSPSNLDYNRWADGLFLASLVIAIANVFIVAILIINYLCKKPTYKAQPLKRSELSISDDQNWTLTLLMERAFARYKEKLIFID